MDKKMFFRILDSELETATGCTEPAAIALTGAYAGKKLASMGAAVESIKVGASGNMIKNAMAAGIPNTKYTGIAYAAAIGVLGGDPADQLEVIRNADKKSFAGAEKLVEGGHVTVELAHVIPKLYIDVTVCGSGHSVRAVISDMHTNLILLEVDGKNVLDAGAAAASSAENGVSADEIAAFLTVEKIFDFCDKQLDPFGDPIDIIRESVRINSAICEEGMKTPYGLATGINLEKNCKSGIMTHDMATDAMIVTAAGADARMAGAPFAVVTNSGSGNQGIAVTMPVVAAARWRDIGEEKMLRAVTLSNLIAIRIKSQFGRLSALCGASVAGTGAACGITYLLGGNCRQVTYAVQNMIGNVAGMLCDGAKADCALKILSCTNAAFQAAMLALRDVRVEKTDGIVDEDVEKTIANFALLGNKGSTTMDSQILDIMINKGR